MFHVMPKQKEFMEQAKLMTELLNSAEMLMANEISREISMKLVFWETMLGRELLVELLKIYTEKAADQSSEDKSEKGSE